MRSRPGGERRRTFAHLVALVELACGVVALVYLVAAGIGAETAGTAGRSVLDRLFLFLLGAAVGGWLILKGLRSWRAAGRPADEQPVPQRETAGWAPSSDARSPRPVLSADGEQELTRVVAVLAAAGVFAPRTPDPTQLREGVADAGEPVLAEAVLMAVEEAGFLHPGFEPAAYAANLAFHDSHVEQFADVLQAQADDLARLAGDGLAGASVVVETGDAAGSARVPTRLHIAVDGVERVFGYAGAAKYLSTELHVALARIARGRRPARRLAWLWSDQGVWLSTLADGEVERLNAALGAAAGEGWEWVDEQQPTAAGDMYPAAER